MQALVRDGDVFDLGGVDHAIVARVEGNTLMFDLATKAAIVEHGDTIAVVSGKVQTGTIVFKVDAEDLVAYLSGE